MIWITIAASFVLIVVIGIMYYKIHHIYLDTYLIRCRNEEILEILAERKEKKSDQNKCCKCH